MASVVDELVVILSLDASKFTAGQKAALENLNKTRDDTTSTAKEMEARGAQGAEFFGKITAAATGLFAILAGANTLEQFLGKTIPQIANLGRIANLLGQSGPDLRAFQLWVEQTGGNADTATQSLLKLSQVMQNFKTGIAIPDATFLLGLNMIGGRSTDSAIEIFDKFAAWTATHTGPEALQEGNRLGLDPDTINAAIRAGPNAARDLNDQLKNTPSEQQIKRVQDLQVAFFNLQQAITGSATRITADLAPALTHLMNLISGLDPALNQTDRDILKIGENIGGLGKSFGILGTLLDQIGVGGAFGAFFHWLFVQFNMTLAFIRIMIDGLTIGAGALVQIASGHPGEGLKALIQGWASLLNSLSTLNSNVGAALGPAAQGPPANSNQRAAPASVPADRQAMANMVRQKAIAAGLNPDIMVHIAEQESGLSANPPANPASSGRGLFELLKDTARQYGINPLDPVQSAQAAMKLVKDNLAYAYSHSGAHYTPGDEYMALFLGPPAMAAMLRADPNALASSVDPSGAASNPSIFRQRTVAQVESLLRSIALNGPRSFRSSHAQTAQHVTIGAVHVHAPGITDARGVAKHVRRELSNQLATQANSALN